MKIPISSTVFASGTYGLCRRRAYLDTVAWIRNAATIEGLYVVLCSRGHARDEGAAVLTEYSIGFSMMKQVVDMFDANPGVIYEPFNEPHEISWSQWIVISEKMLQYWRATMVTGGHHGGHPVLVVELRPVLCHGAHRLRRSAPRKAEPAHREPPLPERQQLFLRIGEGELGSLLGQYIGKFPLVGHAYGISDGIGPTELAWGQQLLSSLKYPGDTSRVERGSHVGGTGLTTTP